MLPTYIGYIHFLKQVLLLDPELKIYYSNQNLKTPRKSSVWFSLHAFKILIRMKDNSKR